MLNSSPVIRKKRFTVRETESHTTTSWLQEGEGQRSAKRGGYWGRVRLVIMSLSRIIMHAAALRECPVISGNSRG